MRTADHDQRSLPLAPNVLFMVAGNAKFLSPRFSFDTFLDVRGSLICLLWSGRKNVSFIGGPFVSSTIITAATNNDSTPFAFFFGLYVTPLHCPTVVQECLFSVENQIECENIILVEGFVTNDLGVPRPNNHWLFTL